jgi:glycosyltransferase involved in cell wall biosynthesis
MLPDGTSNDGTTEYRLLAPARPLIAQGADIIVDTRGPIPLWSHEWHGAEPPPDVRILALAEKPDADVVVLQRPGRRWWADIIPLLQRLGIRVVVDMDDLLDSIDKRNIAHAQFDPKRVDHHNHTWAALACERADVVTVTTPALLERYGYGHGIVLPNLIPERYLKIESEVRPDTAGWTGNVQTHPVDLQATAGAVSKALDDNGWTFHVIGTGIAVKAALGLREEPSATGHLPFAEYAEALGEIELGIVPLVESKFNRAKSCLKMIEFASVGVPVAASATPDNLRMQKLGVGAVVKHPSQWSRTLNRLIKDRTYREHLAGRSRTVMADHTYEKHCWRWAKAWGLEKP